MSLSTDLIDTWNQQIDAAKDVWSKLRDYELLTTRGEVKKLAGLVQQHYWLTLEQAEEQVNNFIQKYKH